MSSLIIDCGVCGQSLSKCSIEQCEACLVAEKCTSKEIDTSSYCITCNLVLLECERRNCSIAEYLIFEFNVSLSALILTCDQIIKERPAQFKKKIARTSDDILQAKRLEEQRSLLDSIQRCNNLLQLRV